LNTANGLTDSVTGLANAGVWLGNNTIGRLTGDKRDYYQGLGDWSYGLVTDEDQGLHDASKGLGAFGATLPWGGGFTVPGRIGLGLGLAGNGTARLTLVVTPAATVCIAPGVVGGAVAVGQGIGYCMSAVPTGGGSDENRPGQATPNRPPSPNRVDPNVPAPQVPPDSLFGRSFQDFGRDVLGWGKGAPGAAARAQSITMQELQQGGVSAAQAQAVRDFYAGVLARNPGNAAAAARVQLADRILQLLGGG